MGITQFCILLNRIFFRNHSTMCWTCAARNEQMTFPLPLPPKKIYIFAPRKIFWEGIWTHTFCFRLYFHFFDLQLGHVCYSVLPDGALMAPSHRKGFSREIRDIKRYMVIDKLFHRIQKTTAMTLGRYQGYNLQQGFFRFSFKANCYFCI